METPASDPTPRNPDPNGSAVMTTPTFRAALRRRAAVIAAVAALAACGALVAPAAANAAFSAPADEFVSVQLPTLNERTISPTPDVDLPSVAGVQLETLSSSR